MGFVNGLHFNNLRGDFYGGLTAAVVALPLALAMGVASGAGPIAGIYGAIFVGFFAALFGGTPAQVSGPTGPMTVVMALIFTQYTSMFPDDPAKGAALAFTVVIMGGLFQILFGVLRIGKYIGGKHLRYGRVDEPQKRNDGAYTLRHTPRCLRPRGLGHAAYDISPPVETNVTR